MENINIGIIDMVEDILFCKKTFGEWQFNRKYHFYEGYIKCLYDNNLITEEQYKKYNDMIYKTFDY